MGDPRNEQALGWLSDILWPVGSTTIEPLTSEGQTQEDFPLRWWASPSKGAARVLIPSTSMSAARTAVHRYHDGLPAKRRLRSFAAETMMHTGSVARRFLAKDEVGVRFPSGGLLDEIAQLMGVETLHVAISLSVEKSNRKPVLQLLTSDGECIGWAKIAWSAHAESLVENEAFWLNKTPRLPVVSPEVLHDVVLQGRRVLITSGFSSSRLRSRPLGELPDIDVFRSVAEMGSLETKRVRDTAWWSSVEAVMPAATKEEMAAIRWVGHRVGSNTASRNLFCGAWHGDLAPWNLMSVGSVSQVIDWEFAADDVPLGFDICHFHTQVAAELKGMSADNALRYSVRRSPIGVVQLGVSSGAQSSVWLLYLVELIRRSVQLRAAGFLNINFGPAALRRLERFAHTFG